MIKIAKKLWTDKFIRIGCYFLIFLLIGFIILNIVYKFYYQKHFLTSDISFFVTTVKDSFEILFFCVVVTITILSYLQAKKTLFTPIKTEIFKLQIKAFEEILLFFQNKGEADFTKQFDLDNIVNLNANILFIDYIEMFFSKEIEIDKAKVTEMKKNAVGGVTTVNYIINNFSKPEYFEKIEKRAIEEITNPALILKKWEQYEYGSIKFTEQFRTESTKLKNLSASPLIPQELKEKINVFDKKIHNNLFFVGKILTDIAKELPIRFPNSKSLNSFNHSGIWNRYNIENEKIEEDAKEILSYIRSYLKVDEIVK